MSKNFTDLKLKTYAEWASLGFHIKRGEKAFQFVNGKAYFTQLQISENITSNGMKNVYESIPNSNDDEECTTEYYADGSGYENCGGPCGPLYFDYNGEM